MWSSNSFRCLLNWYVRHTSPNDVITDTHKIAHNYFRPHVFKKKAKVVPQLLLCWIFNCWFFQYCVPHLHHNQHLYIFSLFSILFCICKVKRKKQQCWMQNKLVFLERLTFRIFHEFIVLLLECQHFAKTHLLGWYEKLGYSLYK